MYARMTTGYFDERCFNIMPCIQIYGKKYKYILLYLSLIFNVDEMLALDMAEINKINVI